MLWCYLAFIPLSYQQIMQKTSAIYKVSDSQRVELMLLSNVLKAILQSQKLFFVYYATTKSVPFQYINYILLELQNNRFRSNYKMRE